MPDRTVSPQTTQAQKPKVHNTLCPKIPKTGTPMIEATAQLNNQKRLHTDLIDVVIMMLNIITPNYET